MKTNIIAIILAIWTNTLLLAQAPAIDWQKTYGGSSDDFIQSLLQTADGRFITVGHTDSNDGSVKDSHGARDLWVQKLNANGSILWSKLYGGSINDQARAFQICMDGGYIVVGYSSSKDGDVSKNKGQNDVWVLKIDSAGSIKWQQSFGGSENEVATSVQATSDGGYIIAGNTESNDGDISGNHGAKDIWLIKIDSVGKLIWQKVYGGSADDEAFEVQITTTGDYIVAGRTSSTDGDINPKHTGTNVWVIKINNSGTIIWEKTYGGSGSESAQSIKNTKDGGFIVLGGTSSTDGDVSYNHAGPYDIWIFKINSAGTLQWEKTIGGTDIDLGTSVQILSDGGYIVAGESSSSDGDMTGNNGGRDYCLVKISSTGVIQWQKPLGGEKFEFSSMAEPTSDGGFIYCGATLSKELAGYLGSRDGFIVKLAGNGTFVPLLSKKSFSISPNPVTEVLTIISPGSLSGSFEIYSSGGKKTLSGKLSSKINVRALPPGSYILIIYDLNSASNYKFVKE